MAKSRTIRFYDDDERGMMACEILKNVGSAGGNKFITEAIIHYNDYLNGVEKPQTQTDVSLSDIKQLIQQEIKSAFAELNKEKNTVSFVDDSTDNVKTEHSKKVKEIPKPKVEEEQIQETVIEEPKEEVKISNKALSFLSSIGM